MDKLIKEMWVQALRSGEYQQGKSCLNDGGSMCCLGVLCDLHRKEFNGEWRPVDDRTRLTYGSSAGGHYLPHEVMQWAGLSDVNPKLRDGSFLSNHNDGYLMDRPRTFSEIADLIEREL